MDTVPNRAAQFAQSHISKPADAFQAQSAFSKGIQTFST